MNEPLPIQAAALQFPHSWGDAAGALARAADALAAAPKLDLVLLPELCLTGYVSPGGDFDVRPFAETLEGPTCCAAAALAARLGTALAVPLVEQDASSPETFYNTLLLFDEAGQRICHWRKRHPWMPETWATPGNLGTPVVAWRGWKITAAICFDLHFIAHEARAELTAADLLLFPSAWVEEVDSRPRRLKTLARQFELTVVAANWARCNPPLPGQGGSIIVGRRGGTMAEARGAGLQLVRARLD